MRECIKAFANIIAADFGMKLLIWRNLRSWWKQVLTTDEICLSIDISDWKITPRFFAHSLGEMVFKLRLMLTGTFLFLIKQEIFSFIRINRQFVSNHPRKNILNASFNRCESRRSQFRRKRKVYLSVICIKMATKARIFRYNWMKWNCI